MNMGQTETVSGNSDWRLSPQHSLLLLALQPVWHKPSFSIDLAWLLSKNSYHRAAQEQAKSTEHFIDPSPSWLSSLDFLERNMILAYSVDNKSLYFLKDPTSFLETESFILTVHVEAMEEAWSLYMIHWATQTSLLNAQLKTCSAEEATLYYVQQEAHFLALIDFLLHQCTTYALEDTQIPVLSPKVLLPLMYRLSYTLGGHLEHLCRWVWPPMLGLALCRCVSQTLDPYIPLMLYHPAATHLTDEELTLYDGFTAISSPHSCPTENLPPHVAVPSRAFLAARVDLAIQLRVHGQYEECYAVLHNTVALSCSLPDHSDLPCTLTTRALLQLAITQQEHADKFRSPENEREIEQALALDLSSSSSSSQRREGDGKSTLALYQHVLKFCESYPRGEQQCAEVLSMQGAAMLGIMALRCRRSRDLQEDVCAPPSPVTATGGARDRSSSLSARYELVQTDEEELKKYFALAKKCTLCAVQRPCITSSIPSTESLSSSAISSHPLSGEMWLRQGELRKIAGDLPEAKDAFMQAFQVFCHYFGLAQNPNDNFNSDTTSTDKFPLFSLTWEGLDMVRATRPNLLLAQACCSLGLVMDEMDEVADALTCYTNSKYMYQLLFGDCCLPAADISVNKAMLFMNSHEMKSAQKELTEALQIYMSRFGHEHADTREIQNMLDSVTARLRSDPPSPRGRCLSHHNHQDKVSDSNTEEDTTHRTPSPSPSRDSSARSEVDEDARQECGTNRSNSPSNCNTHSNLTPSSHRKHYKHKRKCKTCPPCRHKKDSSQYQLHTHTKIRAQYRKYKEYQNLASDFFKEAQCGYKYPLSVTDHASLTDKDMPLLIEFDVVSCQQNIDAYIVDAFLLRIRVEGVQGQKELAYIHTRVQECLQLALQAARQWEWREMRLAQIRVSASDNQQQTIGRKDGDSDNGNPKKVTQVCGNVSDSEDLEQGTMPEQSLPVDHEESFTKKPLQNEDESIAYVTTTASLYIASLLILQADHSAEVFSQKSEEIVHSDDHQQLCSLVKSISDSYQEALSIYKACLGDTNLTVANILVQYASHMLSFLEYTSTQLSKVSIHNQNGATEGYISNFIKQWFQPKDTQHLPVLPLRVAQSSSYSPPLGPDGVTSPVPDEATFGLLETLHLRSQKEARDMLDEALELFRLLTGEDRGEQSHPVMTCNGYDGRSSSRFEVALVCPPLRGLDTLSCVHNCAVPLHLLPRPPSSSRPPHRGDMEAHIMLAHVCLHQEDGGGNEALALCKAHLLRVQRHYCSLNDRCSASASTGALSAADHCEQNSPSSAAWRLQELEVALAYTTLEVEVAAGGGLVDDMLSADHSPGGNGRTGCGVLPDSCAHTYVAEAYVFRAYVLQTLARLEGERGCMTEAGASLRAALLQYRRLFGDCTCPLEELFSRRVDRMEEGGEDGMKDSVALRYAGGEAFVAEGGVRGTTMELAKIYNTLSFFYQEQDEVKLAIEMSYRSLTVLCSLNLLPCTTDNVGPKIGLILCNLGDLLVQAAGGGGESSNLEDGIRLYTLAREVYCRLQRSTLATDARIGADIHRGRDIGELVTRCLREAQESLDDVSHAPPPPPPLAPNSPESWCGVEEEGKEGDAYCQEIRYIDDMLESLQQNISREHESSSPPDGCVVM